MPFGVHHVPRSLGAVAIVALLAGGLAACDEPRAGAPIRSGPATAASGGVAAGSGRIIGVQGGGGSSQGGSTGIGAMGGAVTGGLLGAAVGHGKMGILTGIAGALGGALLGNTIERSVSGGGGGGGADFIVERDDGQIVTIPQPGPTDLRTGDRVSIINDRGRSRLVRAPGGGPPGPGAAPMPDGQQPPPPQDE